MARVLLPLPDRDFDVTEVAVPWRLLTLAGHEIVFCTEAGGAAPSADPLSFGQGGTQTEAKRPHARTALFQWMLRAQPPTRNAPFCGGASMTRADASRRWNDAASVPLARRRNRFVPDGTRSIVNAP